MTQSTSAIVASLYERRGSSHLWWHNKAYNFRTAAIAIRYVIDSNVDEVRVMGSFDKSHDFRAALPGPFMLNAGLSIELLLKGLIVLRHNGDFKKFPKTHNLIELSKLADIHSDLQTTQKISLEILSEYIIWASKYPITREKSWYESALSTLSKVWETKSSHPRLRGVAVDSKIDLDLNNYNELWNLINEKYGKLVEEMDSPGSIVR